MIQNCLRIISVTLAFTALVAMRIASPALADDVAAPLDGTAIDSRELELRRKERELLQTINLTSSNSDSDSNPEVVKAEGQSGGEAPRRGGNEGPAGIGLEIRAPEPNAKQLPVVDSPSKIQARQPEMLQELAHHPALNPRPKTKAPHNIPSNEVRTKSYDEFPDGTTAKRVGTFRRITRSEDYDNPGRGDGHGRVVPIQDFYREPTARPALFSSDELATIRDTSTVLRIGPSRSDSTLMRIPQYTEVAIDYRSGAWYRVRTSAGVRGWVPGSSLLFEAGVSPRSSVKVGGISLKLP